MWPFIVFLAGIIAGYLSSSINYRGHVNALENNLDKCKEEKKKLISDIHDLLGKNGHASFLSTKHKYELMKSMSDMVWFGVPSGPDDLRFGGDDYTDKDIKLNHRIIKPSESNSD